MRKIVVGVVIAVAVVVLWRLALERGEAESFPLQQGGDPSASGIAGISSGSSSGDRPGQGGRGSDFQLSEDVDEPDDEDEAEEPQTEEEKREAEEEKLVNDFDDLTDKWMEPSKKGVTMADIDNFAKQFRQVPKERQDECIHRALNLVPDENVMLLAGVLMDKSMDKEIVETVYNDILNRDEDVKKPILQQIFKDKAHPCWADTAWILDVTGELPKK